MSWNEYWQQFETPFRNCAQGSSAHPVKEEEMARMIRFHIPSSYKPVSRNQHAQGRRGKLIQFPLAPFLCVSAAKAMLCRTAVSGCRTSTTPRALPSCG